MTKKELKQEAKEYADKYGKSNFDLWDTARFAYYQGAEPREKRIAELEAQNERLCQSITDFQNREAGLEEQIAKFKKQHDIVRNERNLFQERCEDILENYYCDHKCKCADLEKENAELKSLKDVADLIRLNNSHIVAMAQLNNNNVALRKENADLKEEINKIAFARGNLEEENAELKSENQKWKDEWQEQVQKATDEGYARTLQTMQLTKAKNLLQKVADVCGYPNYDIPVVLYSEITDFIKDSEAEK